MNSPSVDQLASENLALFLERPKSSSREVREDSSRGSSLAQAWIFVRTSTRVSGCHDPRRCWFLATKYL